MKTKILLVAAAFLLITSGCKKNRAEKDAAADSPKKIGAVNGPANGTYKIINATVYNANLNRVMEIAGASNANGAKAQQWDWFPNFGQAWTVTDVGNNYYKIINVGSGQSLDLPSGSSTPGIQLQQWPYSGADAQLWKIEYQGYGVYKITSKASNQCVTLEANSTNNGPKIIQRPSGENGQFWLFVNDFLPVDNSVPNKTITWSGSSGKLSHDGPTYAEYPRVHRINATNVILTYHFGSSIYGDDIAVRRSFDNGWSWTAPYIITHTAGYWGFSNPETIVLQNGWILLAYGGRGNPDDNAHDNVQVRISTDGGATFGAPIIVATGRSWEPAMIQLATGEIELFYSSEAAWWPSANPQQQILMCRSYNNGQNWTAPQGVAYTAGKRDGMPVPLVLQNDKGIIFPIECVGATQSAWMLWSSTNSKWRYADGFGSTTNGRRWLATNGSVWGGAPFIVQTPAGNTIMSVHDKGGRAVTDWRNNTQLVMVGNTIGKNFVNVTQPWPGLPTNEGAINNSLFMKDATHVMAATSRVYANGTSEVRWKEGTITP